MKRFHLPEQISLLACQLKPRWRVKEQQQWKNRNKFTAAQHSSLSIAETWQRHENSKKNGNRGETQSWLDIFPIVFGGTDTSGKCLDNQDGSLQVPTEFPTHGFERKDKSLLVPKACMAWCPAVFWNSSNQTDGWIILGFLYRSKAIRNKTDKLLGFSVTN